jgi:hypothetical protein
MLILQHFFQNGQKIYKKKLYDPFALQNACKSVQEGLSVYRAARTHGVPESTLRGRTMGYVSVTENSASFFLFFKTLKKLMVYHFKRYSKYW